MPYLLPLFFVTALIYASVGFGGGSTYLALLVLFSFPYESIPKVALICNLVVVAGGLYRFYRAGHLSLRPTLPFAITSIPMATLGGSLSVPEEIFLLLLAFSLSVAGLRLLFSEKHFQIRKGISGKTIWGVGIPVGAGLGFLSGLVGIGGGIFLAPILYFLRWGNSREIASQASFFIFVNSLFGLWGQFGKSGLSLGSEWILPLVGAVWVGGQIGSRLGAGKLPLISLQRITAVLILLVSARIFWGMV